MNYTKEQRRAIHKIFVAAKNHLWDGKSKHTPRTSPYICVAIRCGDYGRWPTQHMAKKVISSRMGEDAMALEDWLVKKGIPREDTKDTVRMQSYRRAWLDILIEEFKD